MVRLVIVEDERNLAHTFWSALLTAHYDVVVSATGEDGFFRANAELFDLVVLDLMLPGRSGLEILQTPRQAIDEFEEETRLAADRCRVGARYQAAAS